MKNDLNSSKVDQKEIIMRFRDLNRQYQYIQTNIDNAVRSVIDQANFISGSQVSELESVLADYVKVRHCITCGNGTDAITIALMAVLSNIPSEDWKNCAVFVPDFTFFSSGECPAALGLPTYFVDVRKETYNISPDALEKSIEQVKAEGRHKPTLVIAVDLFGQPAEYGELKRLCKKYNMFLLEDGAQGFGGRIGNQMACSFADIATTSFFPAKPLGCYGDGGAIFTDNDEWATLCRSIAVHGKDMSNPNDPNAKYNNIRLGMNSRLDTIQAAVLLAKFPTFRDEELDMVNDVAGWYKDYLSTTSFMLPEIRNGYISSWAQYTVLLPEGVNRAELQMHMKADGIPTMVYYKKPMHRQGAFKGTVSEIADCPNTEKLCESVLCLPVHPYLRKAEVEIICGKLKKELL